MKTTLEVMLRLNTEEFEQQLKRVAQASDRARRSAADFESAFAPSLIPGALSAGALVAVAGQPISRRALLGLRWKKAVPV